MDEDSNSVEKTQQSSIGTFWGWIPVAILFLLIVNGWYLVLFRGLAGEFSWYSMQLFTPILGFIFLIVVGIKLIRNRRGTIRQWVILACSILAILPVITLVIPVRYPYFLAYTQPSATVRLPADVPLQVIWGGDTLKKNNHVISPDQRWAYDFLVEPYFSGTSNLEDYGCYGVPVVAPIDGIILAAHDGEPDEVPGVASKNVERPRGNYVVIQMDSGTYLLIAHLKPGSLTVKVGDEVQEGQVIGACGNSGNTSEPHIHIHHQRINPEIWPTGFGEGLPLYFRDSDGPSMPEGGYTVVDGEAIPTGPLVTHIGQ